MGPVGSRSQGHRRGRGPAPPSLPKLPPFPLALKATRPPTRGHSSLGWEPQGAAGCLKALPASPRGGSVASSSGLWAAAEGPSPYFSICCLFFPFCPHPHPQAGVKPAAEEVCPASRTTSAGGAAPAPSPPSPQKPPSDTRLQSEPLSPPSLPPCVLCSRTRSPQCHPPVSPPPACCAPSLAWHTRAGPTATSPGPCSRGQVPPLCLRGSSGL